MMGSAFLLAIYKLFELQGCRLKFIFFCFPSTFSRSRDISTLVEGISKLFAQVVKRLLWFGLVERLAGFYGVSVNLLFCRQYII